MLQRLSATFQEEEEEEEEESESESVLSSSR
jgi:hypothetical protein